MCIRDRTEHADFPHSALLPTWCQGLWDVIELEMLSASSASLEGRDSRRRDQAPRRANAYASSTSSSRSLCFLGLAPVGGGDRAEARRRDAITKSAASPAA